MLEQITPLILTYNEAPNISRSLDGLSWAQDVVVVDNFSDDETLAIIARYPQARVFQRQFDTHAGQWSFALRETGITTEWVLALDADYRLTKDFVGELRSLAPARAIVGYQARFSYCINGQILRSGVYPPVTVLYRKGLAAYSQDGHTHRLIIEGEIEQFKARLFHDDRKPLERWLQSQSQFAVLERQKIIDADRNKLSFPDLIRRLRVVAPVAVLFYCLILRGGIFDGWPGFYYAFQRMLAEVLLSLYLLEHDLKLKRPAQNPKPGSAERKSLEHDKVAKGIPASPQRTEPRHTFSGESDAI